MAYRDVILADSPTIYWPLDSTADATGKGHTLTLGAGVAYYEGALGGTESYNGINPTAVSTSPHTADAARLVYSIECWIKPSASTGGYRCFLCKGDGINTVAGGRNPALFLRPSDMKLHFTQETSTPAASQVYIDNSTLALTQDAWNHVVGTVSGTGGEMRLYVNGVLSDVNSSVPANNVGTGGYSWPSGTVLVTNANQWYVGNNVPGPMDEVAYYPYTLTADQVRAHYEMGLVSGHKGYQRSVKQEQPVAYWSRAMDTRNWIDETHNSASVDFNRGDPNSVSGIQTWLSADAITGVADGVRVIEPGYADLTWTMGSAGGNQYSYYAITGGPAAYSIVSGDQLEYEVYWVSGPQANLSLGMDLVFSGGAALRTTNSVFLQGTVGSWVKVTASLTSFAAQTISTYMITCEGDAAGAYRAYFREARITNGGVVKANIFINESGGAVALPTSTTGTGLPGSTTGSSLTTNTGVAPVNKLPSTGATQWISLAGGSPVYKTGGVNGKPYLLQDGARGTGLAWDVNYAAVDSTIFVVGRQIGTDSERIFSGYRNNWILGFWGNYSGVSYGNAWSNDPSGSGTLGRLTPATTTQLTMTKTRTNATNTVALWNNGASIAPAAPTAETVGPNGIATGGYQPFDQAGEFSASEVYEVIVYNRVLTTTEVNRVNGYLGNKYGVFVVASGGYQHAISQTPGPIKEDADSTYMALTGDSGITGDAPRLRLNGDLTVEFWIYPTSLATRTVIIQKTDYWHEFACVLETDGRISGYWGSGVDGSHYNAATAPAGSTPLNTWTHCVFVRRGAAANVATTGWYINGLPAAVGATTIDDAFTTTKISAGGTYYVPATGTGPLTIGTGYISTPIQARLAEIALYARALTPEAISAHYTLGVRGRVYPGSGGYGG